jgi:hypothetical protein
MFCKRKKTKAFKNFKLSKLDTQKPLNSQSDENEVIISLPSHLPSRSIVEVSENMRAKIYGMFCRLGQYTHLDCAMLEQDFVLVKRLNNNSKDLPICLVLLKMIT